MSEATPPAPVKPPRSPVERAIVWGVIGLGVLVIAVEANAHLAHSAAHQKLDAEFSERLNKGGMTKKHVDLIVGNKTPDVQQLKFQDTSMSASRVDIYTYPALLRNRQLWVYYGVQGKKADQEAEVMDVLINKAPTLAESQKDSPPLDPKFAGPRPGGGGGPGDGSGGGTGGGQGKRRRGAGDAGDGRPKSESDDTKAGATKSDSDATQPADTKAEKAKPDAGSPAADKPAEPKPAETESKKE